MLFLLKTLYFQRKLIEKTHFSADYSNFFALFVAEINKFMYHYDYRTWKWTTRTMQVIRFIFADKAKGVKCLLFSPQYIEHKISTFNEIFNRMKEQKNLSYSLRKVAHPFKSSLNSMFLSNLSLPGAFITLTNVNYVKNAIFENYFEQFSHFSTV